jgi:hypothetical protein
MSDIDWRSGRVDFWDMQNIRLDVPFREQVSALQEDLAQVSYPSGRLVDVGWYPQSSPDGAFCVMVIGDGGWEAPVLSLIAQSPQQLLSAIERAVKRAERTD